MPTSRAAARKTAKTTSRKMSALATKGPRKLVRPRDAIEALLEPEKDRLEPKLVRSLYRAFNRTFYEKTIAALTTPDEARRFAARIRANREFADIRADLCREAVTIVVKPKHREAALEIIALLFDGPPPATGERLKGWGKQVWVNVAAEAAGQALAINDVPLAVRLSELVRPYTKNFADSSHVITLARAYALSKRPADAVTMCRVALQQRWTREDLIAEPGLAVLHSNADFKKLVGDAKPPTKASDEELSMSEAVVIFLSGKRGPRLENAINTMKRESVTDVYDALNGEAVGRFMKALRERPDMRDLGASLGGFAAPRLKHEPAKAPLVELLIDAAPRNPIKRNSRQGHGWLSQLNDAIYYANKSKDHALASRLAETAAPHAAASDNLPHNAACAFAAVGRNEEALAMCRIAVENGYHDIQRMKGDRDLKALRASPEFAALFAATRADTRKKARSR